MKKAIKEAITVRQLLAHLYEQSIYDPSILDRELYIEASNNPNFEKPDSGWKSFRNSEDWLFVQPAWIHGVNSFSTKDKYCLMINF